MLANGFNAILVYQKTLEFRKLIYTFITDLLTHKNHINLYTVQMYLFIRSLINVYVHIFVYSITLFQII